MRALLFLFLFVSCTSPEVVTYQPVVVNTNNQLVGYFNMARTTQGLQPLIEEALLMELAKNKAIQMEALHEVNHDGFTSMQTYSITYSQIVGYGYPSEKNLFNSYMTSDEHRNSILDKKFTHIGCYTINSYNCVIFAEY